MKYTHDIIIIGGGAGGLTVTAGCAQLGMKTALIELKHLGGDCLHYGCVPSKTLIHAANEYAATRQRANIGLPEPEMVKPNIRNILKHVRSVIETIAIHDSAERFTGLGADVFFARPRFRSPYEIELENEQGAQVISSSRIVIATGSSPRPLPITGLAESGYLTNQDIFSITNVPRSLAIIGAGPIGVEMAQTFARLGSKVFLLEIAPRILQNEDADISKIIQENFLAEGITVKTGITIETVIKKKTGKTIILKDGERIQCSEILVAAGRRGNTDLLLLDNAGVQTEHNFITTDTKLRSSAKHILAVGDINGRFLFTHVAGAEGAVAVRRLALGLGGTMNYHHIPRVIYCSPEIAVIGVTEAEAIDAGIKYSVHIQNMDAVDRAHAENSSAGFLKLLLNPRNRIIGAQLIAKRAGDLFTPLIYAVRQNWKISSLYTMLPYPVMSEIINKAASSYLAPKLFNPTVRGILRLLRGYRGKR